MSAGHDSGNPIERDEEMSASPRGFRLFTNDPKVSSVKAVTGPLRTSEGQPTHLRRPFGEGYSVGCTAVTAGAVCFFIHLSQRPEL